MSQSAFAAAAFPDERHAAAAHTHVPHALHGEHRHWPLTNCYVDLVIELLHGRGLDPAAGLAFTVSQSFEGDQFTFFKFPAEDLERLYGLAIQELAIFDTLESHCLEQLARGNTVLVEVDAYALPDTRGLNYRTQHTKTTIGVQALDPALRTLSYWHNAGLYRLDGADYEHIFAKSPPGGLFPYAEFVSRRGAPLSGRALVDQSLACLGIQRTRRPAANPIEAYRAAFPAHMERLIGRPEAYFHAYAFNTLRQLGANFEMLASYAAWLGEAGSDGLLGAVEPARQIAQQAKVMQFRLARIAARRRFDACSETFDALQGAYDAIMGVLDRCPL